ncbi:hypothetical protein ACOQFO_10460 [Ureibacillus sp. MALMAid1270]|uniref:hypothetical protein n=1 Tax=Ureibacillus sp. MALMAid1270 TaxID=3411629 RepID=UPI003BA5E5C7
MYKNYDQIGWKEEEMEYFPKRKVNNNLSWKIHHIKGSFYSNKMQRTIEYESMGECLFYFFLELAGQVKSYYVQPLEIEVPFMTEDGDKKHWVHVPDVLVFGDSIKPTIFQIKEAPQESKKHTLINRACLRYAATREWDYKVIYPKALPEEVLYNIKFLNGFLKKRKSYDRWTQEINYRLKHMKEVTIHDLAYSFVTKINPLLIMPNIYYLIANGAIDIDITKKINQFSEIRLNRLDKQLLPYLNLDGDIFAG